MDHIILLSYFFALLIGMWAVVYSHQFFKVYKETFLRFLRYYLIFLNFTLFIYFITNYLVINFPDSNFADHNSVLMTIIFTFAILFWSGCIFSFIRMIYGLTEKTLPNKVNRSISFGLVIMGIMCVISITTYINTASNKLFFYVSIGQVIIAMVLFFSGTISIVWRKKSEQKNKRQKAIKRFGWMNIMGWVFFFISPFLAGMIKIQVLSIAIISLNLMPIIWLRLYYLRDYIQFSSEENLEFLNINVQKYQLSNREQEVMELILQGKSNKEIEDTLFISYNTVKNHIYNLYQKLGVRSRSQMICFLIQNQKTLEKDQTEG